MADTRHFAAMVFRFAGVCFAVLCQSALATSGWDNYRLQVGRYIVRGSTDYGTVIRHVDDEVAIVVTATMQDGLCGPPSVATTPNDLVIRYYSQRSGSTFADVGCFAIRRDDGVAIGPMTTTEVAAILDVNFTSLKWDRPSLPTHWPYTIILVIIPSVLFTTILFLLGRRALSWLRSRT